MASNRRMIDSERTFSIGPAMETLITFTGERVCQTSRVVFINEGPVEVRLQWQDSADGVTWADCGAPVQCAAKAGPNPYTVNTAKQQLRLQGGALTAGGALTGPDGMIIVQYANTSDMDRATPEGDKD